MSRTSGRSKRLPKPESRRRAGRPRRQEEFCSPGSKSTREVHLDLGAGTRTDDKLVASALAGGDCIDDADVLRTGGTVGVLGCVVKGDLRSFRWGHVRQLGVSRQVGPGLGR